ncbi:MAG: light-harvesting protein [Acetobacteraceae bacterium]|nr:light-harvesting protein [Acetobacteraceae bacterium]
MNQGRIWCVVKPTVGLPLFLGGVATIALLVHASVMTNTTWMSNYWQGSARTRAADSGAAAPAVAAAPQALPSFSITVAPAAGGGDGSFVVTVTPQPGGAPVAQTATAPPAERPDGNTFALAGPPDQPAR